MCEACNKSITVNQSMMDFGTPIVHTKAATPDPAITTSATAFARFQREVRAYFRDVLKSSIVDVDPGSFTDAQSMIAEMQRRLQVNKILLPEFIREFLTRQALAGAEMGLTQLPVGMRAPATNMPSAIERQIEEQVARLQSGTGKGLEASLRTLVGDGLERGETIPELTDRVQQWARQNGDIDRQIKWRARTVARTESSRALNEGQVEAWKESGLTRMKWSVAPNPCDFCRQMGKRGITQPIDQPFFNQGDQLNVDKGGTLNFDYGAVKAPPLHPNCRCTLRPIISFK